LRAPSAGPISFWVTSCRQHQSQTTRRETGGSRLTVSFHVPSTAVAFATFWGYLFFGLIDLMVVFDRTAGFYESYLLETGWGLLYTVMVAAPLVALAFRSGRPSLVAQVAGVGICVAISAVAAFAWRQLLPAAGLVLTAAILYALSGTPRRTSCCDESAHPKSALHWPLLIVACVAIPPSILAALDLVVGFWQLRQPTDDDTWSIDHWPMQAALALSLPAVAVLASFRASGWRTSLWSAAISAAWWGAVSLSYPQHAGSLGDLGGWSAIVWSIALLLAGAVPVAARPSGVGLISPQE
jgi:hypothetical protein